MTRRMPSDYEIVRSIGEGEHGVVYLARDKRLGRLLALRRLPQHILKRKRHREALLDRMCSAAVLSHPNVCTTLEILRDGDRPVLAFERTPGDSLAVRLEAGPLAIGELLSTAIQVGRALVEAHRRGIVHGALKSSNVIVDGESGSVKVTDFGVWLDNAAAGGADRSRLGGEGLVVRCYWSPEQVGGAERTVESDVWAWAVLLYEMIAGCAAFRGDYQQSVAYAIVHRTPRSPQALRPDAPEPLCQVVRRALDKDPHERFPDAAGMLAELEAIKRDWDAGVLNPKATPRQKLRWAAAGCCLVIAASAAALSNPRPTAWTPTVETLGLAPAPQWDAAPSPDGKRLAFSCGSDVCLSYTESPAQSTNLVEGPRQERAPSWSPDGEHLAFIREFDGHDGIVMAAGNSEPESLLWAADDGSRLGRLAWVTSSSIAASLIPNDQPAHLILASAGVDPEQLTKPPAGWFGDGFPALSPNGTTLALRRARTAGDEQIVLLDIETRAMRSVHRVNGQVTGLAWTPAGDRLIYGLRDASGELIYHIALEGGDPVRLPLDGPLRNPRVETASGSLLLETGETRRSLVRIDLLQHDRGGHGLDRPAEDLIRSAANDYSPRISPDGKRLAFVSDRTGAGEVWTCTAVGALCRQLTQDSMGSVDRPEWDRDGEKIVYQVSGRGAVDAWVVERGSLAARQITRGSGVRAQPAWSLDGDWVYVSSDRDGRRRIWKTPAGIEGDAVRLTSEPGEEPVRAADGGVYFTLIAEDPSAPGAARSIWRVAAEGGPAKPVAVGLPLSPGGWLPGRGGSILWVDARASAETRRYELRHHDPASGQTVDLARMQGAPPISGRIFDLAPAGDWVAAVRDEPLDSQILRVNNLDRLLTSRPKPKPSLRAKRISLRR